MCAQKERTTSEVDRRYAVDLDAHSRCVSDDAIKPTDTTENSYPFPTIWTNGAPLPRVNTLSPELPMRISDDLPLSAHAVCTQVYSFHAHSKVRRILAVMEHSETTMGIPEIPGKHTIPAPHRLRVAKNGVPGTPRHTPCSQDGLGVGCESSSRTLRARGGNC